MRWSVFKRINSSAGNRSSRLTMSYAISLFAICVFVCGSGNAQSDELTISAGFAGKASVAPTEKIEMTLSRAMLPADGTLAVLIGDTDVTAMLIIESTLVSYTPRLPLLAGECEVTAWLALGGSQWKEIARFPLRVAADVASSGPSPIDGPAVSSTPIDNGSKSSEAASSINQTPPHKRRWGFDKIEPIKSISLNIKSQPASAAFPEPPPGTPRESFTDLAGQAALGVSFTRGAFNWSNRFEIAGTSFQNEALRFSELGQKAPQVDLASYHVQLQHGSSNFALGHVAFGTHRHLINNFSSRGLTVRLPLGNRADFTAAAVNGTSVVGWSNFFGLSRRKHQMVSGVLGFELLRSRPQGLRVEAGVLSGSLLPLNNFSQRTLTDAERSFGGSLRLIASDPKNRFRIDAGFTRSRFTNPTDPLLEQGLNLVPVRETTRSARFADASFVVLRDLTLKFATEGESDVQFSARTSRSALSQRRRHHTSGSFSESNRTRGQHRRSELRGLAHSFQRQS